MIYKTSIANPLNCLYWNMQASYATRHQIKKVCLLPSPPEWFHVFVYYHWADVTFGEVSAI